MKQDANPISQGPFDPAADQTDRPDKRHQPASGRGARKLELKMTSMIDVVFLLLIFFIVTANFELDEGTLQANLPGSSGKETTIELTTLVDLRSSDDGMTYSMSVNGVSVDGASELSAYMTNRVRSGLMASDDPVEIKPQGVVRWQHVLNVYNACVNAELERVTFAY